jgi:anthraniloyl-CoA monooxygenase
MGSVMADFVQAAARNSRRLRHAGAALRARLSAGGFISPLTNVRTDAYGGSLENHALPAGSLCRAATGVAGRQAMSVRISGDWKDGGLTGDRQSRLRACSRRRAAT